MLHPHHVFLIPTVPEMATPFPSKSAERTEELLGVEESLPESKSPKEVVRRQQGGFDCEFLERPQEAFQVDCPICLSVLREPYLISCCGYNFCRLCIERVQLQNGSCPTCNEAGFSVVPNKGLKRSLYAFKVQCSHKKEGCQWTSELGELDKHLNVSPKLHEQLVGCEFSEVECHHCCDLFQRRYVTAHQIEECIRRPFSCDYCGNYGADFEDVTTKHWPVCGSRPVPCPNECGVYPERQNLEHHVSKDCPLTVINCDFCYAGCEVQLPRKNMPTHAAKNVVVHMSLMAVHNQQVTQKKIYEKDEEIVKMKNELAERKVEIVKLKDELGQKLKENKQKIEKLEEENEALKRSLAQKTEEMERKLEPLLPSLPVEFTMTDFDQYKKNKEYWYSPPFYTHPRGYKMCLRVNPDQDDKHISVGVRLMRGDFDSLLKWPFEDSVAFKVLNQLEDSEHYRFTAVFSGTRYGCRVTDGDRAGHGRGGDVAYDKLHYSPAKHCHYLKDNCLHFRVTHIVGRDVLQLQRQCLAMESRVCLCPVEFTMAGFELLKHEHSTWISPSFYTHTGGYRMCLRVSTWEGSTHIGVYACLMMGEFDNSLKWPFRGNITIQLLTQEQSKRHYERNILFTDTTAPNDTSGRVTGYIMKLGLGWADFISYDKLIYDPATKCRYLCNDCLHFRITAKVKN